MGRFILKCITSLFLLALLYPISTVKAESSVKLVSDTPLNERLHEIVLSSSALGKETSLRVLLPSGYDEHPDVKYPVLYLLHGCCGDYKAWTARTDIEKFTENMPLVIVMPDAGKGASYSDWYNNGAYGTPQWEKYHINELIPWIEQYYHVNTTREGRAVAGLSMGGFGSMSYAARHPDLFAAAASFSGVLDTNLDPDFLDKTIFQNQEKVPPGTVWGERISHEIIWRTHNPWDLAENLAGVDLSIYTGNGEAGGPLDGGVESPVEKTVFNMSASLHNRLEELDLPHVWESYGNGSHTWGYWQRDLHETLPRFMEKFRNPSSRPVPFSYKTAENSFTVYGWQVKFQREDMEFARLSQVSKQGFSITGSGAATITTAPWFKPNTRYKIYGMKKYSAKIIKSDRQGRLHLNVGFSNKKPKEKNRTISITFKPLR
ncbi:alpha/beta hydrolase [Fictibacillus sp. NRS-1165]|uniref:alpha/beta hydrolase n=1 Tax=Fictibacillus sp. NRS-1165 TaxID=3144463 RepID=UPI003D1B07F4